MNVPILTLLIGRWGSKVDRSPKDLWRLSVQSYSQLNNKHVTASLLVHHQKVKMETLPNRKMQLPMNKKLDHLVQESCPPLPALSILKSR